MSNLEIAADKIAIMDVVYKYCRAIDRLDRELLESVFHDDSIHHHGEYEGPSAQFCDFAFDILSKMEHTQHLVGNILVEVDGNVAWSESYWQAFHRIAKGKDFSDSGGFVADHDPSIDEDVFVSGRYIDKFEKREGEWRIVKRQGVHDWVRFEPATDKGWREGPGPAPGRGRCCCCCCSSFFPLLQYQPDVAVGMLLFWLLLRVLCLLPQIAYRLGVAACAVFAAADCVPLPPLWSCRRLLAVGGRFFLFWLLLLL